MTSEYLLPCACGRTTRIGARQAGETIECECGSKLDVPTMREMRRLEPAGEAAVRPKAAWGPRQGLAFIGLLLTALSLSAYGYFQFVITPPSNLDFTPSQAQLDNMRPSEAWMYWRLMRQGSPTQLTPEANIVLVHTRYANIGKRVSLGLAVAGLALAASGRLLKPKKA